MLPLPPWMPTTPVLKAAIAGLGLALATPLPAASEPATSSPAAASPAAQAPTPPVSKDMSSETVTVGADQALEAVLECGLRVRIARDRTLPVAAVILAVETGPEDDPPELPGLTHALAYQVLQGNRELRPGEAVETVHGGGGVANLAVGHAQVRYESLVPASRLDQTLWIESERLRFPTTRASTWKQALGWAQSDPVAASLLGADARAAAHRTAGLGHDGRRVGDGVRDLTEAALAIQLRARFDYARSTLVVVAPEDPAAVLATIEPLFADLPRSTRKAAVRLPGVRARGDRAGDPAPEGATPGAATPGAATPGAATPGSTAGSAAKPAGAGPQPPAPAASPPAGTGSPAKSAAPAPGADPKSAPTDPKAPGEAAPDAGEAPSYPLPETVLAGTHRAPLLAWSIPGTPEAQVWAAAVCRALARQRRVADEDRKLRLSCVVDPDPRRATLLLQVTGTEDLVGAASARLQRLLGRETQLLATQGSVLANELRVARSRPLELARQLAAAAEISGPARPQARDLDAVTGVAALADPAELPRVFPSIVDCGGAVLLVRPEAPKP
ncbi:MAG: hypothetical protein R3B09_23220 [Nannocystaceae bacterium]